MLEEGSELYDSAIKAYSDSKNATKRRIESRAILGLKVKEFDEQFMIDRKKANIVFLSDPFAQSKLELTKSVQLNRLELFDISKTFYIVLSENPEKADTAE